MDGVSVDVVSVGAVQDRTFARNFAVDGSRLASHNLTGRPVSVRAVALSGEELPVVLVPVLARLATDVDAAPSSVHFGPRLVGSVATETVTLRSAAGCDPAGVEVLVGAPSFSARIEETEGPAERESNIRTIRIRVDQTIQAPGEHQGEVRIAVRSARSCEAEGPSIDCGQAPAYVTVPITYHGIPTEIPDGPMP